MWIYKTSKLMADNAKMWCHFHLLLVATMTRVLPDTCQSQHLKNCWVSVCKCGWGAIWHPRGIRPWSLSSLRFQICVWRWRTTVRSSNFRFLRKFQLSAESECEDDAKQEEPHAFLFAQWRYHCVERKSICQLYTQHLFPAPLRRLSVAQCWYHREGLFS